jgi:non-heme chloroperoxidase
MGTITTKDGTEIFYKDAGSGQPIVFSHGWPLSSDDWDTQMLFFLNRGFRVIAQAIAVTSDVMHHLPAPRGMTDMNCVLQVEMHDMDHYADDLAALTASVWSVETVERPRS